MTHFALVEALWASGGSYHQPRHLIVTKAAVCTHRAPIFGIFLEQFGTFRKLVILSRTPIHADRSHKSQVRQIEWFITYLRLCRMSQRYVESVLQGLTSSHLTQHASLYLKQRATAKTALIDMSVGLRKFIGGTVFTTDIDDLDDQTHPGNEQHMPWER